MGGTPSSGSSFSLSQSGLIALITTFLGLHFCIASMIGYGTASSAAAAIYGTLIGAPAVICFCLLGLKLNEDHKMTYCGLFTMVVVNLSIFAIATPFSLGIGYLRAPDSPFNNATRIVHGVEPFDVQSLIAQGSVKFTVKWGSVLERFGECAGAAAPNCGPRSAGEDMCWYCIAPVVGLKLPEEPDPQDGDDSGTETPVSPGSVNISSAVLFWVGKVVFFGEEPLITLGCCPYRYSTTYENISPEYILAPIDLASQDGQNYVDVLSNVVNRYSIVGQSPPVILTEVGAEASLGTRFWRDMLVGCAVTFSLVMTLGIFVAILSFVREKRHRGAGGDHFDYVQTPSGTTTTTTTTSTTAGAVGTAPNSHH